jgi:hypothetical protein
MHRIRGICPGSKHRRSLSWSPLFYTNEITAGGLGYKDSENLSVFGANAFINSKYILFSLGYAQTSSSASYTVKDNLLGFGDSSGSTSNAPVKISVALAIYGKYPIDLSGLTLFPIVGIEYDLNLSYKDSDANDLTTTMTSNEKADLNALFIKAGLSADIPVADRLFVRPAVFADYKLHSKLESDSIDNIDKAGGKQTITSIKVDVGLSIGYKL